MKMKNPAALFIQGKGSHAFLERNDEALPSRSKPWSLNTGAQGKGEFTNRL